jgi:phosphatidate cytidylyltransferase
MFPVGWALQLPVDLITSLLLAGVIGDLFVSLCKRRIGIKDISDLLGAHGGWLDRVDSVFMGYVWLWLTQI